RGQLQATQPSTFLRELPEGPIVVRDLSGVGSSQFGQSSFSGAGLPFQREPRTAGSAPEFRLMTAADLLGRPAQPGAPAAAGQANIDEFRVGVAVVHPEFGLGRIMALEGEGSGRKGRVAFAFGRERTFILAKAPLRAVGRSPSGASPRPARGDGSH